MFGDVSVHHRLAGAVSARSHKLSIMLIIAHRGCDYDGYNQNTIRAFRRVFDEGAPAAEFDVQKTQDGELVIVHDLELDEVSTGTGPVAQTASGAIRALLAGNPPCGADPIPFFAELLDLAEEYPFANRPLLNIELKARGTGIAAAKIVAQRIAENRFAPRHFLVSSFIWDELQAFADHCPGVDVALLAGAVNRQQLINTYPEMEAWLPVFFDYPMEEFMLPRAASPAEFERIMAENECPPQIAAALQSEVQRMGGDADYDAALIAAAKQRNAVSLNLWYQSVTASIVNRAHAAGLKILAYTVNTLDEAEKMRGLGVDGIFTDFYSRFKDFAD